MADYQVFMNGYMVARKALRAEDCEAPKDLYFQDSKPKAQVIPRGFVSLPLNAAFDLPAFSKILWKAALRTTNLITSVKPGRNAMAWQ